MANSITHVGRHVLIFNKKLCLNNSKALACHRQPKTSFDVLRYKSDTSKKDNKSDGKDEESEVDFKSFYYPNTPVGMKERTNQAKGKQVDPLQTPYPPFPDGKNPKTGEKNGPSGPEPTRYGDWERKGRVTDF